MQSASRGNQGCYLPAFTDVISAEHDELPELSCDQLRIYLPLEIWTPSSLET